MRIKQTTTTTLVMEALISADDLLSTSMLVERTRRSRNQVSAACYWLWKARAIDVVVNPDGTPWWFALPAIEDRRVKTIEQIVVGIVKPGRRNRRSQKR